MSATCRPSSARVWRGTERCHRTGRADVAAGGDCDLARPARGLDASGRAPALAVTAPAARGTDPPPGRRVLAGVEIHPGGRILLGEISVGDHVQVGANAVVAEDVPPGVVVVWVPARHNHASWPIRGAGDRDRTGMASSEGLVLYRVSLLVSVRSDGCRASRLPRPVAAAPTAVRRDQSRRMCPGRLLLGRRRPHEMVGRTHAGPAEKLPPSNKAVTATSAAGVCGRGWSPGLLPAHVTQISDLASVLCAAAAAPGRARQHDAADHGEARGHGGADAVAAGIDRAVTGNAVRSSAWKLATGLSGEAGTTLGTIEARHAGARAGQPACLDPRLTIRTPRLRGARHAPARRVGRPSTPRPAG